MLLLVKDAELHTPARKGRVDILCAAGKVMAIAPRIDPSGFPIPCEILDAGGMAVVPGFVDSHVHVTGGGGEGGFRTRTPELAVGSAFLAGVTTVVGVLGTDGVSRSMEGLVAKVYGLREEGLSAWCYSGSYGVPLRTLTGDLARDIMMIQPVIGAGEVAVSDHRSSQPTVEELARIAAVARVAGMLSGKAGIVNVHLGDAPEGLEPLVRATSSGGLPRTQFLPTHCARSESLFAQAVDWARSGGYVDFTASALPGPGGTAMGAAAAFARLLAAGIPASRATISSDGQGSLPVFDADGNFAGLGVGGCSSIPDALRAAVTEYGIPLEEALLPVTLNPARILKLGGKGRIEPGADADLVVLDRSFGVRHVVSGGKVAVRDGTLLMRGTFERAGAAPST